jgi:hypothetical protein
MMHFYQGEHRQAAKLKRPPAITLTRIECDSRSNLVGSVVGQDVVPYTAGLATHFKLMMGKESVPHAFLDSVAELAFVQDVLASIRFWWKPSYSCGPQFPEWRDHVRFFNAMLKVSRDVEKRTAEAVAEDS